ncbi:diguanylate cyclase and metal dependent phosphohydrolase [Thermincola ferriacetica]|uniref:Diguanylate cyclase and metal dependent phosphohydrolase n=1 Tax=Thermincola ferriacetica TaxID=281456 RepID=A0A0L6W3E6_9FIRM|nr:sensor domain-containing diguanylate cyclase [Thermincola ferriacetica]KNZ69976.1 diguanylate cyclase and metal dependent phosphohydrolase [Thermincola ferriacetica]
MFTLAPSNDGKEIKSDPKLFYLHEFALLLYSNHDIRRLLRYGAEKIQEIMGSDGCHILLTKQDGEKFKLETAIHCDKKPFPVGVDETKGISGLTFKTKQIIIVTNAEQDSRVTKKMQQHFGPKSLISVPILVRERVIGVLLVYSQYPSQYTYRDGEFLMMLGNHLGLAVEKASLIRSLEEAAILDPLTGAYNYRFFRSELECLVKDQADKPLSLIMLDLNCFKQVNDTYGHLAGDYILKEIASLFKRNVRNNDIVFRNGGDEFAIILPGADEEETKRIAARIEQAVAQHTFVYGRRHIKISVSWGAITTRCRSQNHINKIISIVDKRLYEMKRKTHCRIS